MIKIKPQLEKTNNMDNNQRITYTKNCLEFLHYKCVTPDDKDFRIYQGKHNNLPEMIDANFNDGFLNNWNWIMEVKNAICNLSEVDEFNTEYDSLDKKYYRSSIYPAHKNTFNSFYSAGNTEKEVIVEVINQFLIWYNEQRT